MHLFKTQKLLTSLFTSPAWNEHLEGKKLPLVFVIGVKWFRVVVEVILLPIK